MKYRIETGIESRTSLSTVKAFTNVTELVAYIKELPGDVWYVVEDYKSNIRLMHRNEDGSMKFSEIAHIPNALKSLAK